VHVNVKDVVALSAAVATVPLAARLPLQPPEAVQLLALVELHESVEVCPEFTVPGFALRVTVGAAACVTETTALAWDEPPAPAHVSRYVVLALMGGVA
jgi:hypothetical protein